MGALEEIYRLEQEMSDALERGDDAEFARLSDEMGALMEATDRSSVVPPCAPAAVPSPETRDASFTWSGPVELTNTLPPPMADLGLVRNADLPVEWASGPHS